jgi:hypothetical protein
LIEWHSIPASQGRIAGYRIGDNQSGGNGTILQPVVACEFSPMSESGHFDRSSRFGLAVDVCFGPKAILELNGDRQKAG